MSSSDESDDAVDIFQEPSGYFQEEKPATYQTHTFLDTRQITLRLVGQSPLWGHHLWQAGKVISFYIESHSTTLVRDKTVLELGAGAGLPSLTAALHGAATVVATDYPDADLIANLAVNVESCKALAPDADIHAAGLLWGGSATEVLALLPEGRRGFDVLILADVVFNHSEHGALVRTVGETLGRRRGARALVFFSPYRPWLLEKDLGFFEMCREAGMGVEKVLETRMEKVMFEGDPGDELLRRTVFGYEVTWAHTDD